MSRFEPTDPPREGEVRFPMDPGDARDAHLAFIGRVRSPWVDRASCPKNMRLAREGADGNATVEVEEPFRPALQGLQAGVALHLLTWLHGSRRDLAVQKPRRSDRASGTFALRSPVRPNPIGLHLVRLLAIDPAAGRLVIDCIDVLDGTPLLDIKPFFASVDIPPPDAG